MCVCVCVCVCVIMYVYSLVAQMVKNLPAMQETQVWSLGWEDPLEKGMATDCSILTWKIPWTEEPGGLQCKGWQRVGHNWETNTLTFKGTRRTERKCDLKESGSRWSQWEREPHWKGLMGHSRGAGGCLHYPWGLKEPGGLFQSGNWYDQILCRKIIPTEAWRIFFCF